MGTARRWAPIRDYESDPTALAGGEVAVLARIWASDLEPLAPPDPLAEFHRRLRREWAIETGLIERVYAFDPEITELLIERGIDSSLIPRGSGESPEAVASMIRDHEAAIEFLFDFIKEERPLSTSYIKELHQLMTRNQLHAEGRDPAGRRVRIPLLHGDWKLRPNNPTGRDGRVHQYCPPEQVTSEMDRLIELHQSHEGVAPEVEAAWLHHRFTQIHPFQDGNGRIARALATLVMLKAGRFPLVVRSATRSEYLDTLEKADEGDLRPLVRFFSAIQRRELVRAIGLSHQVERALRAESFISATRQQLEYQQGVLRKEWNVAKDRADDVRQLAAKRLGRVQQELEAELLPLLPGKWRTFVDSEADRGPRSHFFRQQIVSAARRLDYFAGLESYRSWARLVIDNADQSQILFAFHGIGREFRGVLACCPLFFQRLQADPDIRETGPVTTLSNEVFQVNYQEDPDAIQDRFEEWMEDCIVRGLEIWTNGNL